MALWAMGLLLAGSGCSLDRSLSPLRSGSAGRCRWQEAPRNSCHCPLDKIFGRPGKSLGLANAAELGGVAGEALRADVSEW